MHMQYTVLFFNCIAGKVLSLKGQKDLPFLTSVLKKQITFLTMLNSLFYSIFLSIVHEELCKCFFIISSRPHDFRVFNCCFTTISKMIVFS